MAIIRDTSGGSSRSSVTSISSSVIVTDGSGRRLVVVVNGNDAAGTGPVSPSGVTYGGTALTKRVEQGATTGVDNHVSIWELVNPGAGTATLTATSPGTFQFVDFGWVVFRGASQLTEPHGTIAVNQIGVQNMTISGTPTVAGAWAISGGYPETNPSQGISGATEFLSAFFTDAGYSGPHAIPGTVTHTYSGLAAGENWVGAMILIAPEEQTNAKRNLLGVGL